MSSQTPSTGKRQTVAIAIRDPAPKPGNPLPILVLAYRDGCDPDRHYYTITPGYIDAVHDYLESLGYALEVVKQKLWWVRRNTDGTEDRFGGFSAVASIPSKAAIPMR